MQPRPVIWVISDGKAGHESQSLGLASALADLTDAKMRLIRLDDARRFFARPPKPDALGAPEVVIGAGSRTHATIRACGRAYGARTLVLMRPSLGKYGLIVAPMHDRMAEREGVVLTRGAITRVRPSDRKDESRGLILVGGPSKHHGWDGARMMEQITAVVCGSPGITWTLTTSRRTPDGFAETVEAALGARAAVLPVERTTREWLLDRYAESATVWATEDSVSMVYEALTSGAGVGLLRVPRKGDGGRVVAGIDALARDGYAIWFEKWREGEGLSPPPEQLDEASRVALIVAERFGMREIES